MENENGIEGGSTQEEAYRIRNRKWDNSWKKATTLTVTQTAWYLSSSEMQSNFISADTRDTSKSNSIYYELLSNNGSEHWLASRCVESADDIAIFAAHYTGGSSVDFIHLSYSDADTTSGYYAVRPIVTPKSNIIDIDKGYDESMGGWQLK